jgi:hypothetical protein
MTDKLGERIKQSTAPVTLVHAHAFGATRTPEAFLFDKENKLVYHGTIDDSTYDAAKVTHPYLENALESLVAGKAIADPETKSVGCTIKFRSNAAK